MLGGWSGEKLGTGLDAPGSFLWELETAIRDSELSGNLAHELLPLPGLCNLVPLDAPVLS